MKKVFFALLLSLLIMSLVTVALAAVPSKTTADLMTPVGVVSATNTVVPVTISKPSPEHASAASEELAAIATFVQQPGASMISYFDETTQEEIKALLPEGFDAQKLTINEFLPVKIDGYQAEHGDLVVSFTFATEYTDGQPIVAMIGFKEEGTVTWVAQKAEVVEGVVKIYFTQDVLLKMKNGEFMLTILSEA